MTRILFVCLGNICRSPTAEAAMRRLVQARGLQGSVEVDSAGTGNWHVGESPDERATATARRRGLTLDGRARQVSAEDFERFDLILAMDGSNANDLRRLAPDEKSAGKVRLLREFEPDAVDASGRSEAEGGGDLDVPDPYFGGSDGFERVIDLVTAACEGVLDSLGLQAGTRR